MRDEVNTLIEKELANLKEAYERDQKAKKGKGPSPRELARQKMIEAQEEADAKKGRGFFGR